VTELNITELLNQKVLEFGNERFLEGWNGQQERIIKLLENEIQRLVDMAGQREGGPAWRSAGIENCEHLIALIKGENK